MFATLVGHLLLLPVSDALKPVSLAWTKDKFKASFSFLYFCLVAINMHFVLAGISAIRFVQHQSEASLRLCCKSLCILSMLSLAMLRVPSSANKSHFTDLGERHRGKSLIKIQTEGGNTRGPRIGP